MYNIRYILSAHSAGGILTVKPPIVRSMLSRESFACDLADAADNRRCGDSAFRPAGQAQSRGERTSQMIRKLPDEAPWVSPLIRGPRDRPERGGIRKTPWACLKNSVEQERHYLSYFLQLHPSPGLRRAASHAKCVEGLFWQERRI